jgi:hypothetical protein
MTDATGGNNGRGSGGNGSATSGHPAVLELHDTLDAIEQMLHGGGPMCDLGAVTAEIEAVSGRSAGLRASLLEISESRGRRRRARRSAAG